MYSKDNNKKLSTNKRASESAETQKETYQIEFDFVIEIERTQKNKNQIEFLFRCGNRGNAEEEF